MVEPAAGDADPGTRVIRDLGRWLGNGQRAWLCTVVRTWGSSPRPAGSLLAVNEKGSGAVPFPEAALKSS